MFGLLGSLGKGASNPDDLAAILRALGVDISMTGVSLKDAPAALRQTAIAAGKRGASLHRLTGRMKDGSTMEAFITLVPATAGTVSAITNAPRKIA